MKQKGRAGDRFLFLLPTSLVLLLIIVIPFLLSFYLSLTSWNGVSPRLEFVGLQNFKEILAKPGFFTSPFSASNGWEPQQPHFGES